MHKREFYSNGKLLLSGEYAILDGAYGWAMPTKFGQYLKITENTSSLLSWKSLDEKGKVWFQGTYHMDSLEEGVVSDHSISRALLNILLEAKVLNPTFLTRSKGCSMETVITFPRDWGLGSSSTLINNIANWAKVDAYKLLDATFGGSGYDIACAQHNNPILFRKNEGLPIVHEMEVEIPFKEQLYFIYLNQKRNSRDAIADYKKRGVDKEVLCKQISDITEKLVKTKDMKVFENLLSEHESLISKALGIPTVKENLFPDYQGTLKSLGAWGGDFILATGNSSSIDYFRNKGYHTVIPYVDMALQ